MDLNVLSQYANNNTVVGENTTKNSEGNAIGIDLHNVFSAELNALEQNGFASNIDAYKNTATGETTVAIGLKQEGVDENYILVKKNWNDNKWDMNILGNKGNDGIAQEYNLKTSMWLASRGLGQSTPDQICIEGLTIEEILKLCE